jgi:uncharacterized protein (DUF305 family)
MTFARFAAAVLLTMGLVACGGQAAPSSPAHQGHPQTGEPAQPTAAAPGRFGPTERAFTELAIAIDDQAVKLLDQGAKATATALRDLAKEIGAARRAELAELHGLLDASGITYLNNHEGHDMPGMPTAEELGALSASGTDFDKVFAGLLRAHLDESTVVVKSVLGATSHADTKAVAEKMAQERATDLPRLDRTTGSH